MYSSDNRPVDPAVPPLYPMDPCRRIPYDEYPCYKEPIYENPIYHEPIYHEPIYQEPIYQEPVYQEPIYYEPAPMYPVMPPHMDCPMMDPSFMECLKVCMKMRCGKPRHYENYTANEDYEKFKYIDLHKLSPYYTEENE